MFIYEELKTQPRKFLSQTSLTVAEFEDLLPAFEKACLKKYPVKKTKVGKDRKRKAGAGRKSLLDRIEQKLLFALVYQKSYPLQSIMGELFGMGQSQANKWIHELLPILKQALDDLGVIPERAPKKFKSKEKNQKDAENSIIDGTEDAVNAQNRAKNRLYTIAASKKPMRTRT
jgi:hypothetical protein